MTVYLYTLKLYTQSFKIDTQAYHSLPAHFPLRSVGLPVCPPLTFVTRGKQNHAVPMKFPGFKIDVLKQNGNIWNNLSVK